MLVVLVLLTVAISVMLMYSIFVTKVIKILNESGYLLGGTPQLMALPSEDGRFCIKIEFSRWLTDDDYKRIETLSKFLFGAKVRRAISGEYNNGYQDLILEFFFKNSGDADYACHFFTKYCHFVTSYY